MICSNQITKNDGPGMWHVWGSGEVHMGFWRGNLTERDYLEDLGTDGILKKQDLKAWTGLIWAVVNIAVNPQVP